MGSQILECQKSKNFTLFTVYFRHTILSNYRCSVRIHQIAGPNPGPFSRRLEMCLCQPSSGLLPFLFLGYREEWGSKERNWLRISYALSKIHRASDPHCPPPPYSHKATREALTFTCPAGGVIHGSAAHHYSILLCHLF